MEVMVVCADPGHVPPVVLGELEVSGGVLVTDLARRPGSAGTKALFVHEQGALTARCRECGGDTRVAGTRITPVLREVERLGMALVSAQMLLVMARLAPIDEGECE